MTQSNADFLTNSLPPGWSPGFNPNPTAPPNRFGPGVASPIQQPLNNFNFAPNSFNAQAAGLWQRGMPPEAFVRPSPPGGSPPPPTGTPPPPGGGGPSASPYATLNPESPWLTSLPQGTIQRVNDYYTGVTAQPKRANSQMVQDFFMVNLGRRATPREVEYYTDGKRFDQLFTNTGKGRASANPARTGNTGTSNTDPLDQTYWDWWEQQQAAAPQQQAAAPQGKAITAPAGMQGIQERIAALMQSNPQIAERINALRGGAGFQQPTTISGFGGMTGQNKGAPGQIPNLPFNMNPEIMQRIRAAMAGRA